MKQYHLTAIVTNVFMLFVGLLVGQDVTQNIPINLPHSRLITHPQVRDSLIRDFESDTLKHALS